MVQWSRRGVLGAGAALMAGPAMAIDLPFVGGGSSGDAPVAQTRYGAVRGRVEDQISVFKGIPYGAPTGGGARFLPPEPARNWGGTRDCTDFGPQCPQPPGHLPPPLASWDVNLASNEDCLSLNVWTPGGEGRRPVMVWIHDSFIDNSGALTVFDGVRLCKRGDVVVVTVNHRLNAFGYLYLGGLEARFADSGNVGQLDLVAALQWVRDNIANFGGDPGRVTLFGQGDGGAKISALMAMPAARGLFHRAAIQSGADVAAIPAEEATRHAQALLRAIGAGPGVMQVAPFTRVLDGLREAREGGARFGPVIDGRNLMDDPFNPTAPAGSADVPILVGCNAAEAAASKSAAGRLTERKAAQASAGAYLYRLEFASGVERLGAARGLDVPLVFDKVAKSPSLIGGAAANAQIVADTMSAAWIAFARTGSPNAAGLPSWPRYDPRARSMMLFNVTSRAVNDPYAAERRAAGA
jgi:para-nitrobenzyl esterase